jgi:hypothetical protein
MLSSVGDMIHRATRNRCIMAKSLLSFFGRLLSVAFCLVNRREQWPCCWLKRRTWGGVGWLYRSQSAVPYVAGAAKNRSMSAAGTRRAGVRVKSSIIADVALTSIWHEAISQPTLQLLAQTGWYSTRRYRLKSDP